MNRYVISLGDNERLSRTTIEMNSQYDSDDWNFFKGVKDNRGSTGISMSFKKAIIENYQEPAVHILEDDIKFTAKNSRKIFESVMEILPKNWDIFLGGSYWYEIDCQTKGFIKVLDFSSLHNAVIRKSAYDKLLAHDVSVQDNIDRWLGMLSKQKKLNVFLCDPQIAIQHPGYSYNINRNVDYSNRLKKMNVLYG
jgi:hypothetical protein